jgi:hypothetical protein
MGQRKVERFNRTLAKEWAYAAPTAATTSPKQLVEAGTGAPHPREVLISNWRWIGRPSLRRATLTQPFGCDIVATERLLYDSTKE